MKKTTALVILALGLSVSLSAKPKNSFAIISDAATYAKCGAELDAYRDILVAEGLDARIIAREWKNPEEVKSEILALRPSIEGAVFVGDVPIVLVRGAQFMTTAFKMNEKIYPPFESSVPSDRFYDDFDLKFDFIEKDSEHEGVFYYNLSKDSAMRLSPDIYTARMRVPEIMEGDKYEIMAKYLRKVVAAHKESGNKLDNMTFFAGHGYNSDCLTIWRQKPLLFKEAFPECFKLSSGNRFMNFREAPTMKYRIFTELRRPGTDYFQFSEHGAPETQYINGIKDAIYLNDCVDGMKREIARYYKKYKGGEEEEAFCHEVMDSVYHIDRKEFSDSAMARYAMLDSLDEAERNISAQELCGVGTNAKVVVLNACYNGSFHNPEGYVAGAHVFSDGDCIVAQGNTVNVLQDKWEDELVGYLAIGERVGMWQKELCYLESHLIGDPTFRFAPASKEDAKICAKLHADLTANAGKASVWEKYCTSEVALLRAAGITHLAKLQNCSDLAMKMFCEEESAMVRRCALEALKLFADENASKAAKMALEDPMEVIAVAGIRAIGDMSDTTAVAALSSYKKSHPENLRAAFLCRGTLGTLKCDKMMQSEIAKFSDKTASDRKRISCIRTFRNNRCLDAIAPLLEIVAGEDESLDIRLSACEALGWYNASIGRGDIAKGLKAVKSADPALNAEIEKTLRRIEAL